MSGKHYQGRLSNGWKTISTAIDPTHAELLDVCVDVTGISRSAIVRALVKAYIDSVTGLDMDPQKARVDWAGLTTPKRHQLREAARNNLFDLRHHMNSAQEPKPVRPEVTA